MYGQETRLSHECDDRQSDACERRGDRITIPTGEVPDPSVSHFPMHLSVAAGDSQMVIALLDSQARRVGRRLGDIVDHAPHWRKRNVDMDVLLNRQIQVVPTSGRQTECAI
jgi:hypothetical protein